MFPEKPHSVITAAFALFNLPTHPWGSGERKSDEIPKSCFVTHSCVGDQVTEGAAIWKIFTNASTPGLAQGHLGTWHCQHQTGTTSKGCSIQPPPQPFTVFFHELTFLSRFYIFLCLHFTCNSTIYYKNCYSKWRNPTSFLRRKDSVDLCRLPWCPEPITTRLEQGGQRSNLCLSLLAHPEPLWNSLRLRSRRRAAS